MRRRNRANSAPFCDRVSDSDASVKIVSPQGKAKGSKNGKWSRSLFDSSAYDTTNEELVTNISYSAVLDGANCRTSAFKGCTPDIVINGGSTSLPTVILPSSTLGQSIVVRERPKGLDSSPSPVLCLKNVVEVTPSSSPIVALTSGEYKDGMDNRPLSSLEIVVPPEGIFLSRVKYGTSSVNILDYISSRGVSTNRIRCVALTADNIPDRETSSSKLIVPHHLFGKLLCPKFWPINMLIREFVHRNTDSKSKNRLTMSQPLIK